MFSSSGNSLYSDKGHKAKEELDKYFSKQETEMTFGDLSASESHYEEKKD
jgi:hypothetical protein